MYNFQFLAVMFLLQGNACYAIISVDHIQDSEWIYNDNEPLQNTIKPDKVKRSAGKLSIDIVFLYLWYYTLSSSMKINAFSFFLFRRMCTIFTRSM